MASKALEWQNISNSKIEYKYFDQWSVTRGPQKKFVNFNLKT